MHRTRTTIVVAALAALALCAPAAHANYRVGISEQSPAVFDQPAWQALKLKRIRSIIPWDYQATRCGTGHVSRGVGRIS